MILVAIIAAAATFFWTVCAYQLRKALDLNEECLATIDEMLGESEKWRNVASQYHRRAQSAESRAIAAEKRERGQFARADWWRSEAHRLGWQPDYDRGPGDAS